MKRTGRWMMGERGRWARFGWMASGAVIAVVAYEAGRARADGVPAKGPLVYSGYLTDADGAPIEGTKTMSAALFASESSKDALCPPSGLGTSVEVKAGRFTIPLDEECAAVVHSNTDAWVEVMIEGQTVRSKIAPVPYALEADSALHLGVAECPRGYEKLADNGIPGSPAIVCVRRASDGKVSDQVVRVGSGPTAFWIDRYEASVWDDRDGTVPNTGPYGKDFATESPSLPASFPLNGNIDKTINLKFAVSRAGVPPSGWISWFQANLACRASGKRLPSGTEWLVAAAGTTDPTAGSDGTGGACVTKIDAGGTKRQTGEAIACMSVWGAEDMIGNLAEWTDEWFPGVGKMTTNPDKTVTNPQVVFPWPPGFNGDGVQNIDSATVFESIPGVIAYAEQGLPAVGHRGGGLTEGTGAGIYNLAAGDSPASKHPVYGFRCVIPR